MQAYDQSCNFESEGQRKRPRKVATIARVRVPNSERFVIVVPEMKNKYPHECNFPVSYLKIFASLHDFGSKPPFEEKLFFSLFIIPSVCPSFLSSAISFARFHPSHKPRLLSQLAYVFVSSRIVAICIIIHT
mmetsp:Transcript_43182/g.71924  ORF Transcript_43182/g.71924 Transcript_43182/m.71924 type:complete len:132 (+) Transcript_43182:631-1026(+)